MGDDLGFRRVGFDLKHGRMEGIAFGNPKRAPDILFLHATGLNALTYGSMLQPLKERFHVLAVDLRGHGRTTLPKRRLGYTSWYRHRDDVAELIKTHFHGPVTMAGHSMGGTVSLLLAGSRPEMVNGVCMIDPVLMPPSTYAQFQLPGAPLFMGALMPIARSARRRRKRFESRDAAFEALKGRGFFKTWPDETLRDYVEDGFIDVEDGVKLACSPAFESRTFAAQRQDPWRALTLAKEPIVLLRAEHGSTTPESSAKRIAAMRLDVRLATAKGATHALPMEQPDRARAAIETAAMLAVGKAKFTEPE